MRLRSPSPLLWPCLGLAAAALLRVWVGLREDGLYWPDEVHQSLEPAHRLVFGYGLVAWEFVQGARNWALPGLVAALFELARGLGLEEPWGYLRLTRVAFALMGVGSSAGAYWLARRLGARVEAATCGALLFALGSVPVYFGHRAMSENAAALPLVLGLALALPREATRRQLLAGAALLALATLLRLQCGLLCAGLLGVLAARRQWAALRDAGAVLLLGALAYGLLDRLTWGEWFQSARVYLAFNLQGGAERWGTAPFSYYARVLFSSMPGVTLALAVLALVSVRRAPALLALILAFGVLHALQPHKELRFLVPVLPLLAAAAGVGLEELFTRARGTPARLALGGGVVLLAVASAAHAPALTFGELGQYEDSRPDASAWDDAGSVNRLLAIAGQQEDLCGLKVEVAHLAWTGGYSYLHREVPLYPHFGPRRDSGYYNYVLTLGRAAGGGEVRASDGPLALVRLQRPGCVVDPQYSWHLN